MFRPLWNVLLLPLLALPKLCLSQQSNRSIPVNLTDAFECGVTEHEHSQHLAKSLQNFQIVGSRVVGGHECPPHAWPWMAQVLFHGQHRCGGTIIDPQVILTAAHCFSKTRAPSVYTVLLGGHQAFTGHEFDVRSIHVHPLYQAAGPNTYDFALIRLAKPAHLGPRVRMACLPSALPLMRQVCVVTGWGARMENGKRSDTLQEAHVPLVSYPVCNDWRHYNGRIQPSTMLCAGLEEGRLDSCQGDSGGPLMCVSPSGHWEVQGVVSWGVGCARQERPGVYAKVAAAIPWIRQMFQAFSRKP